jgi:hypothetical protein
LGTDWPHAIGAVRVSINAKPLPAIVFRGDVLKVVEIWGGTLARSEDRVGRGETAMSKSAKSTEGRKPQTRDSYSYGYRDVQEALYETVDRLACVDEC